MGGSTPPPGSGPRALHFRKPPVEAWSSVGLAGYSESVLLPTELAHLSESHHALSAPCLFPARIPGVRGKNQLYLHPHCLAKCCTWGTQDMFINWINTVVFKKVRAGGFMELVLKLSEMFYYGLFK